MADPVRKYFPDISGDQLTRLSKLEVLYREWNSRINVISRKDIDNFVLHHLVHSLSISKFVTFRPGTRILDAGTGGGFPGIPLAVIFPDVSFTLGDSIGKKITVADSVARSSGLHNVETVKTRIEELKEKFDFVVSRAVTSFPAFVLLSRKLLNKKGFNETANGILYLKGGDLSGELGNYSDLVTIYDLNTIFTEEYFNEKKLLYLPVSKL